MRSLTRQAQPIRVFLIGVSLLSVSSLALGETMKVPFDLQAELFKRIFSYDRAIPSDATVHVFVVHEDGKEDEAEAFVSLFGNAGVDAFAVSLHELATRNAPTAIYVLPDTETDAVQQFCAEGGVLSLSGLPGLAQDGKVAIAIGAENERPKIIVNLSRLKTEGHDLSSDLLRLAKVIP